MVKDRRILVALMMIFAISVNHGFGSHYREIYPVSKKFSVMKDDMTGFYLLCYKKRKVLDTLSYNAKDSLFNFSVDPMLIADRTSIRLKFDLSNKSKGENFTSVLYAKKVVIIDVSAHRVTWSFLYQLEFARTDYHKYEYPNDANTEEETNFGYTFEYEVRAGARMEITSVRTSGFLARIDSKYLRDYASISNGKEGVYSWINRRWWRDEEG